jgi:predicted transcriptional regulator
MKEHPTLSSADDSAQITSAMLDDINEILIGNHYRTLVAIIRLEQRAEGNITGAKITREVSRMHQRHHGDRPIRRSLSYLEQEGIVAVDRGGVRRRGHDNRLTDWGWYLAEAKGWDRDAQKIDPDAELPPDAPRPPGEDGEGDGGGK